MTQLDIEIIEEAIALIRKNLRKDNDVVREQLGIIERVIYRYKS